MRTKLSHIQLHTHYQIVMSVWNLKKFSLLMWGRKGSENQ